MHRLDDLLQERAPVLRPEFDVQAATLQKTLDTDPAGLSPGRTEQNASRPWPRSTRLCGEALDLRFVALALGQEPPAYDARCPFQGLAAFDYERRAFFFGREKLIGLLRGRLAEHNFLAVLGPSGSGKSSLVMAGLTPALERQHPGLRWSVIKPGRDPLHELDLVLGSLTTTQTTSTAAGDNRQNLASETGNPQSAIRNPQSLLVVDQFEELFTLTAEDAARRAFIDRLLTLSQEQYVILTMRADFWGDCAPYPALKAAMQDRQELIPPMDLAELRSAMEQQAQSVGLRFEADLANTLLDDVAGEPGAMPLLQHALLELWKRRHGRWLRAEEYRDLGGVREAIARTADGVYDQAAPDEQRLIRDIFLRLTRVDEGAEAGAERRDTRRRVVMTELVPAGADPGPTRELVKRLADASLVVTSLKKKAQVAPGRPDEDPQRRQLELVEVEVAHEALIRHWKRLEDWLNEDRDALRLRQNLNQDAGEWEQGDRAEALLPRWNALLEEAQVLAHRGDLVLSSLEQDYLQAAAALRDQEAAEKEAQQQQELEQQRALAEEQRQRAEEAEQATAKQSKLTRIAFGVGAVALILAILAGVAGLWAKNSANEADRQRSVALAASTAEARQKATAEAASTVAVNERNKAQAEAERAEEEARKAMGSRAEALAYQVPAKGSEALVSAVKAIGPYLGNHGPIPPEIVAGLTAAVVAGRGSIPLQISGDRITFARLSMDDEFVFTASEKGNLHIWDRHDGHQQIQLERVDGEITEVAFSPAKNLVAAATERGGALWNVLSGELIYIYEGTTGDPAGFSVEDLVIKLAEKSVPVLARGQRMIHAALSSDMKLILTSDGDGTLQLWDRHDGQLLREFDNISPSITQIAFSPAGKYVGALTRAE